VASLRGAAGTTRLERVAPLAVADIKVIPDHREHHRVRAVQQVTIFDGLKVHLGEDGRGALAIPAKPVADFRCEAQRTGHGGQCTTNWISGKDQSTLELTA
jgi:hypothetical protein